MSVIDRSRLPNAFEFVTVAGARARQLLGGCTPRVEASAKTARTAEREVLSGAVQALDAAWQPREPEVVRQDG
jgi:DNA-directed RNA polymerase subunit K/omega